MKKIRDRSFGTVETINKICISSERLRYWEKGGIIQPEYVQHGTRRFRRYSQKIDTGIYVKKLVDEEKHSLEGAKKKTSRETKVAEGCQSRMNRPAMGRSHY